MPRPRVAALALVAALSLTLSGCDGLITRDLAPSPTGATGPAAGPAPSSAAPSAPGTAAPGSPAPGTPAPAAPAPTGPAPAGTVASDLAPPAAVPSIRPGTWALGDSFLLGSASYLRSHGVRVDAAVGRQFSAGLTELRTTSRAGALPRNVVVHLGTNGTILARHCDSVFGYAGPGRRVFLVTVAGPRPWMAPNDRVLKACRARHAGQAVLIDWAAVSAPHPAWFGPDHVHPDPVGRRAYDALILAALRRYGI